MFICAVVHGMFCNSILILHIIFFTFGERPAAGIIYTYTN